MGLWNRSSAEAPSAPETPEQEAELVSELRTRLAGLEVEEDFFLCGCVDSTLRRFCVAAKWDLAKAELMFKKAVKGRDEVWGSAKDHGAGGDWEILRVSLYRSVAFNPVLAHTDDDHMPVVYQNPGRVDFETVNGCTSEQQLHFRMMMSEFAMQSSLVRARAAAAEKLGREVPVKDIKMVQIVDVGGLSLGLLSYVPTFKAHLSFITNTYPEITRTVVVVNAPGIFGRFWNLIKGVFDERQQKKVTVFAKGPEQDKFLRSFLRDEDLIEALGGKRPDNEVLPLPEPAPLPDTFELIEEWIKDRATRTVAKITL
mmetsp:Transcript_23817/g.77443  ORF Transcript_23817/g.77443 Transcript_23817/m.77443 type:complete len:313 (-) Transcript_23817:1299-2237(-)